MCNGPIPSQDEQSAFSSGIKILMPRLLDESHVTRDAILSLYFREGWAPIFSPLNIKKFVEILPSLIFSISAPFHTSLSLLNVLTNN